MKRIWIDKEGIDIRIKGKIYGIGKFSRSIYKPIMVIGKIGFFVYTI